MSRRVTGGTRGGDRQVETETSTGTFSRLEKELKVGNLAFITKLMDVLFALGEDFERMNNDGEHTQQLDGLFKKSLQIEAEIDAQLRAVRLVRDKVSSGDVDAPLLEDFQRAVDEDLSGKAFDDAYYASHEKYKKFRSELWAINHEDEPMPALPGATEDEDIVVGGEKQTYKCPITLMWFVDPVRNTVCNHVYSRDAVAGLATGRNRSAYCPIGGCGQLFTLDNLVSAKDIAEKTARAKERAEEAEEEEDDSYEAM